MFQTINSLTAPCILVSRAGIRSEQTQGACPTTVSCHIFSACNSHWVVLAWVVVASLLLLCRSVAWGWCLHCFILLRNASATPLFSPLLFTRGWVSLSALTHRPASSFLSDWNPTDTTVFLQFRIRLASPNIPTAYLYAGHPHTSTTAV